MFDGLSKREIIAWALCLAVALGLTISGGTYLASSLMSASADMTDTLKPAHGPSQDFR
jgi:cell division protein FtsX